MINRCIAFNRQPFSINFSARKSTGSAAIKTDAETTMTTPRTKKVAVFTSPVTILPPIVRA